MAATTDSPFKFPWGFHTIEPLSNGAGCNCDQPHGSAWSASVLHNMQWYDWNVKRIVAFTWTCFFNGSQLAKNEKSTFLTCPCHIISRVEAIGLKSSNYTLKIINLVNMWNLGQFLEKLIFCQKLLN